jgi:hypothetical protein
LKVYKLSFLKSHLLLLESESSNVCVELKKVEESVGAIPGTGLADLPAIPPATQYQECGIAHCYLLLQMFYKKMKLWRIFYCGTLHVFIGHFK